MTRSDSRGASGSGEGPDGEVAQHYAEIFRSLPSGVVFQDPAGRVVDANPAAERILGRSLAEMQGATSDDPRWEAIREDGTPFPGPEHPAMVALRTGQPVAPTRLGIRHPKEAEHRWLLVAATPLFAPGQPTPHLACASFQDVTEQVRAEGGLRTSEERYRSIIDSSPMGMHAYRLEGDDRLVFTAGNPAADRLTGADCQLFVGQTIEEAFPPLAETEIPAAYRRVIRTGEPWRTDQVVYEDDRITGVFEVHAFRTGARTMAALFLEITERKRSEQALRASEARYRTLVDASPDAICAVDAEGRIRQANRSLATLHGYREPGEVEGRLGFELIAEADRPRAMAAFAEAAESGSLGPVELRMERRDGARFDAEVIGATLPSAAGQPRRLILVTRDITPQKRAQALIRRQRDLAQGLTTAVSVEEALELCVRFAIDATAAGAGVAYLRDPASAEMNRVFSTGFSEPYDGALARVPGGERPAEIVARAERVFCDTEAAQRLHDGHAGEGLRGLAVLPAVYGGQALALLVLASREVDDFDEADRALLDSVVAQLQGCLGRLHEASEQRKLAALVESSSDMIGIVSPAANQVRYLNHAARSLIGNDAVRPDDPRAARALGANSLDHAALEQLIAAVQATGRCSGERQMVSPRTGAPLDYIYEAFSLPDGDDVAFALTDVTARRRAEEALREAERRAAAERAELQQQLAQSQKMEAIGRLAGGVAHDFNNLLTGIGGYAEMLLLSLDERSSEHADVKEIQAAASRAASLTSQLLAFSRKQLVAPKVLDLNRVVAHSQRMLGRIIGEDIELRFCGAEALWRVRVDPTQVDQILVNLATNSRDALPNGGKLTIETQNVTVDEEYASRLAEVLPGQYVLLAVSDDGEGMDATAQRRAFEPFFSTKEVGRGTGLGLSTVYGIVRQSEGFINLYSEQDVGTTVKIYLPRVDAPLSDAEAAQAQAPKGRETVLIVEDEAIVLDLTRRLLERQGYRVLTAGDGQEACELDDETIDEVELLLTDVVMPRINGRELYARLLERRPGLRVLYMSGYTENVIAHHGVLEEGTRFIQKPFAANALVCKVREVLDAPSS